jgi:hypothetical protein
MFVAGVRGQVDDMYIEDDEENDTGEQEFDTLVEICEVSLKWWNMHLLVKLCRLAFILHVGKPDTLQRCPN